jgi:hypothetical protein
MLRLATAVTQTVRLVTDKTPNPVAAQGVEVLASTRGVNHALRNRQEDVSCGRALMRHAAGL